MHLVVVGRGEEELTEWQKNNTTVLAELDSLILVNNQKGTPYSIICNRYLQLPVPTLGIVHSDTTFLGSVLDLELTDPCEVTGIVGRALSEEYVWGHNLAAGERKAVSTLDGCGVFFNPQTMFSIGVTFDEKLEYHLVIEDFCLQAQQKRCKIRVPYSQSFHKGRSFKNSDWESLYIITRKYFTEKWKDIEYATT